VGGKAGYGIDKAAMVLGQLLNRSGYRIYIYHDYPSLIRGGHTFSIIRASGMKMTAHRDQVDLLLALNPETFDLHRQRLRDGALVIYDTEAYKTPPPLPGPVQTMGLPISRIVREEDGPEIMRNTCMIGAFAKAVGIRQELLAAVIAENFSRQVELNVKIATRGFAEAARAREVAMPALEPLPLISGSQALGLGLIRGGLQDYVAYPMTPTTPLLHFLAEQASEFSLKVIHPENELGVILMALGFAYAGEKTAVGTSGGGFCLMTESLSLSGMSEVPVVIVLGQRPGPSTGLPTYSAQTDLHFALNAGQGEFVRLVVAPGDLEEAYCWSARVMELAWKYQIPAIILTDKNLNEGVSNFELPPPRELPGIAMPLWDRKVPYQRYTDTETGISPLAFVPEREAVIKVNSYEHDEFGLTTEDTAITAKMQDKRLRKGKFLLEELRHYPTVKSCGNGNSSTALLCWGSNKGVCGEVARNLGLKMVQPIVLSPFPVEALKEALAGVTKLVAVENSATGQLTRLITTFGIDADETVLKYDGRPFTVDELEARVKEKIS
jgi:2-oxoglutarate/2-oxoacid ferredoxin oxidoreductase subunit alpha